MNREEPSRGFGRFEVMRRTREQIAMGQKLWARRHPLSLTREEVAKRVGLKAAYIEGIEHAKRNPAFLKIIALARALDMSPWDLFLDPD